jgi:hypothetical protein
VQSIVDIDLTDLVAHGEEAALVMPQEHLALVGRNVGLPEARSYLAQLPRHRMGIKLWSAIQRRVPHACQRGTLFLPRLASCERLKHTSRSR